MNPWVRRSTAVLSIGALALVVGCGGNDGSGPESGADTPSGEAQLDDGGFAVFTGEPEAGGTVTVLGGVDFRSLDPAVGNDGNVNNLYQLLYRYLTQYTYNPDTEEMELVGDLAEDWESNDDASVWTFTLKEGIYFEDGSEITADDVKFGLERAFDPSLAIGSDYLKTYIDGAAEYPGIFDDSDGLDSIRVIDERTIEFSTDGPMAAFPYILATPPGAPFPADQVDTAEQIGEAPISSGPYKVSSYQQGEQLTLERNEHWDADSDPIRGAYADNFEFLLSLDDSTIDQRLIAQQGGDADAVASSTNPLQAASLAQVQQNPELAERTVRGLPTCTMYLGFNTTIEPLDELEVRQALSYAVDKQSVVNASGGPVLAEVAHDMLLPAVPQREEFVLYDTDDDGGDPQRAEQMLADSGYDQDLEFTMDVRNLPMWQAQAEAVQQAFAEIGVDLTLNVIDAATYYETIQNPSQQSDMAITGWCAGGWYSGQPLLEPLFHGERISETGNNNLSQFDDAEINEAFDAAALLTDIDEQNAAYSDINRMIMEQAPVVPLVRQTGLQMVGDNVGGAFAHPSRTGYIDYSNLGLLDPDE